MARSYDAAVAALTLDVPFRWIDNLLSRHDVPGVEHGARGATRRLSPDALRHVATVRLLNEELGIPVGRAVDLAREVLARETPSLPLAAGGAELLVRVDLLDRRIAARLADAVESAPRRPRGRPTKR